MKDDELVKALRNAQEKYKNDIVSVGRIRIDEMERDCADHIEQLAADNTRLQAEYDRLRNELCNRCGRYKEAHNGACGGCRWKKG